MLFARNCSLGRCTSNEPHRNLMNVASVGAFSAMLNAFSFVFWMHKKTFMKTE